VDDGALKKGIVKRYTILTTGQYSGTTNVTINSKTDVHSNNCVFDDHTGLMWSRYVTASVGPASDGKLPWTTTGAGATEEGIFPYVAAANAASLAGWTDWRIPSSNELESLVDFEAPSAYPNSTAFPSFPAGAVLWSSTTRPDDTTNTIRWYFLAGTSAVEAKTTNRQIILVRG
jgi:hypothetical protein